MRLAPFVVALALPALVGCPPIDTWSSRVQDPGLPPLAPEHLLRKPADFKLYEASVRKEFFLYFYEDELVKEDLVVVIDHGSPYPSPRFATVEEHEFALELFTADWRARGDEAKLRYFKERYGAEKRRKDSRLDDYIYHKQGEIRLLEGKVADLEADLGSRKATGTFAAGDEKLSLAPAAALESELARTRGALALARVQLYILEYRRSVRDLAGLRGTQEFAEGRIRADDLVGEELPAEKFVQEIRLKVAPGAWATRPEARLSYDGGELVVWQTRDVILQIRDYVDRRRADERLRFQGKPRYKSDTP